MKDNPHWSEFKTNTVARLIAELEQRGGIGLQQTAAKTAEFLRRMIRVNLLANGTRLK